MSTVPVAIPLGMSTCPICNLPRKPKSFKKLFEIPVCKKCLYRFANRRQFAYLIDWFALFFVSMFFGYIVGKLYPEAFISDPDHFTLMDGFWFALSWVIGPLAFGCKDGFNGQSPGKWLTGVQVVDQITRQAIGFLQSFKRNLILVVPMAPLIVAFTLAKGRRSGDKWAGTEVIWKKYRFQIPFDRRGLLCMKCGYNLTGNQSGRCPECGTDINAPLDVAAAAALPVATVAL